MDAILKQRRKTAASAWQLEDQVVLIAAGNPVLIPGRGDQTYPFRAHSEYFYLTDRDQPGGVLAFDPQQGWTDFVPEVTEAEKVWTGEVDRKGTPLSNLKPWLRARLDRPLAVLGCALAKVKADPRLGKRLSQQLTHARRPKDAVELDRMRKAYAATQAGFKAARQFIRPGVSERQVQVELEAAFFRAGGQRTAYDTIVGGGPNAGVLHFSPTQRKLGKGELVLIDAGAEYAGYACDVTRTYAVSGRFSSEQRDLCAVVLRAQKAAVRQCRAGKEFREIHLDAALDLTQGLIDMGLLRGSAAALVEQQVSALFFPHGLGHLVGLGVRDASGYLPGRRRSRRPGLKNLRLNLPLQPGYVVTIEPGLYFIPALLGDQRRRQFKHQVHWQRVDRLLALGGVRIEDNVLVTAGEPDVLTAGIPKGL